MIDRTRVADGYLFATHGDRCFYLGKSASDRLHWLKENPGKWRSLEDVKQAAARLRPPVESETNLEAGPAEPYGQTSSHMTFERTAAKKATSPWSMLRPAAARLRTNRQRYPYRYKQSLRGRRKLSFCRPPTRL